MSDTLDERTGLPDALKTLLAQHPREGWRSHPEFGPLTQFWLEKHMGFRRVLDALQGDLRARIGGDLDPQAHAMRLSRLGGGFLNELHGHHSIEDHHYFPKLVTHAPGLERGFEILDADHHQLHHELETFADRANAVLRDQADAAPRMEAELERMSRFLDRHLTDEEDLVVPVILKVGEGAL